MSEAPPGGRSSLPKVRSHLGIVLSPVTQHSSVTVECTKARAFSNEHKGPLSIKCSLWLPSGVALRGMSGGREACEGVITPSRQEDARPAWPADDAGSWEGKAWALVRQHHCHQTLLRSSVMYTPQRPSDLASSLPWSLLPVTLASCCPSTHEACSHHRAFALATSLPGPSFPQTAA